MSSPRYTRRPAESTLRMPETREPDPRRTRLLIEAYLSGDQAAQRQLFDELRYQLNAEARRRPRWRVVQRRHAVEDVISEVWKRLLLANALRKFEWRGTGSLRRMVGVYLDRTMEDMVRRANAVRRGGGRLPHSLDWEGPAERRPAEPPGRESTPSSSVFAAELVRLCDEVLEGPDRSVWRCKILEGLTTEETAREVGLTPRQVKATFQRARAKLSIALKEAL